MLLSLAYCKAIFKLKLCFWKIITSIYGWMDIAYTVAFGWFY